MGMEFMGPAPCCIIWAASEWRELQAIPRAETC
jgi:hypothetical protein